MYTRNVMGDCNLPLETKHPVGFRREKSTMYRPGLFARPPKRSSMSQPGHALREDLRREQPHALYYVSRTRNLVAA